MTIYKFVCPYCGQNASSAVEHQTNMVVESEVHSISEDEDDVILPEVVEYGEIEYHKTPESEQKYICPLCTTVVAHSTGKLKELMKMHGRMEEI